MSSRILVAGATGAIGSRLLPMLRAAGHRVVGITRTPAKIATLLDLGAEANVIDVFDAPAVTSLMESLKPDIVIHQLTDLPKNLEPAQMKDAIVRNARVRKYGTANLVQAAVAAGVRRFIAQSIAWAYTPGPEPHLEVDPLDVTAEGDRGITVRGVTALEDAVLKTPPLEGIVLRYGHIFGPGTHARTPSGFIPLHVDAAAYAAMLAIDRGAAGAFNVAQSNAHVSTAKAVAQLGWNSEFRLPA
ncbi:MAG TPA: NAD(P)-dependent oxidoreductase [Steroidobacteraceae bacterium]|jgi:nucleoside-diphosphate-sugar epimerase